MRTVGYWVVGRNDDPGFEVGRLFLHRHVPDRSRIGVGGMDRPRVSGGLAFVLGRDLAGPEMGRAAVLDATNYVVPCLTVMDDASEAADGAVFLLGNPPTDPRGPDLATVEMRMLFEDAEVAHGLGGSMAGHPADAVTWVATWLAGLGGSLTKGSIIATSTFGPPIPAPSEQRVTVDLGALGHATCELIAGEDIGDPIPGAAIEPGTSDEGDGPVSVGRFEEIYDPEKGGTERWCLNDHCFAKGPDGLWHMFGITHIKPFNHAVDPGTNLAHATARTLLQVGWHKESFVLTADPDRYDEHLLWAPHIVLFDGVYHLFVCVGAREGYAYAIHRYTSRDLWAWERTSQNPVLVDSVEARDPMVIFDGERWILYYTATEDPAGGHFVVAAATSSDLITWSERQVVFTHAREGGFGGPTESPFVVRRGTRYYLFITDDDTVHVYASGDPLHWTPGDHVYAYTGHACEIVRDEEGAWFISHVGWEQDGLKLAPLTWRDGLDDEPASIDAAPAAAPR